MMFGELYLKVSILLWVGLISNLVYACYFKKACDVRRAWCILSVAVLINMWVIVSLYLHIQALLGDVYEEIAMKIFWLMTMVLIVAGFWWMKTKCWADVHPE